MSLLQLELACSLLKESFGALVEKVSSYLLHHGGVSLADIIGGIQLAQNQVKKSLCVLIQHQFVTFELHAKGKHMIYHMTLPSVLEMVRYPRCISTGKVLFGDAGELIVEDLLQQGQSLMSHSIQRVSERLEDSLASSGVDVSGVGKIVKQQFIALVEGQFVQRVSPCNPEVGLIQHGTQEVGGVVTAAVQNKFVLPPNVEAIRYVQRNKRPREEDKTDEPKAKRKRSEKDAPEEPDAGIVWHINFDRFHQYFRDQAIIQAVSRRVDSAAGCVMRTVLNLISSHDNGPTSSSQPYSPEVFAYQVCDSMPTKPKLSREEVEQYLKALADDDTRILCKSSVSGGGVYKVDFRRANELLCQTAIEMVVRERFGPKAYRIFRLLLSKRMLEQQQVAETAMLPSKEAKEVLYTLLAENFVSLQEVPRTPDHAPSRTFYLFTVSLNQVARILLERCYQSLNNLILKRVAETANNKRLLDKYEVYERTTAEEVGSGEEELEELLTPDEKKRAESVKRGINKLEHAELQVDETVFMITSYLAIS